MFFSPEYQKYKEEVIKLFRQYVDDRKEFQKYLQQQDNNSDEDVQIWQKTIDRLETGKYSLVVLGEAGSGKSSFINGLLGKPILPTNIGQCTSAIVDIVDIGNEEDNKTVYLKTEFANKEKETEQCNIQQLEVFQEKLKGLVSIPEKYENIAKNISNSQVEDFHKIDISNTKEREEYVKNLIKEFKDYDKLKEEEITSKVKKCKEYLESYGSLSKIPRNVTIEYPLGFKLKEKLHILDTPGVDAEGKLEKLTFDLINGNDHERQVNAIIFINQINKNPSSRTFADFVRKQALEDTFLFLTKKKSCNQEEDAETSVKIAKNSFKQYIDPERIIAVDSMLKLVWEKLRKNPHLENFQQLFNKEEPESEKWRNLLSSYVMDTGLKNIDEKDIEGIVDNIYRDSNYEKVKMLLQKFFRTKDEELNEIVYVVLDCYQQQEKDCNLEITLLNKQREMEKSPEEFAKEINQLKDDLEDYLTEFNKFSSHQSSKYTGVKGDNQQEWSSLSNSYLKLLEETYDEFSLQKCFWDFRDEANSKFDDLVKDLKREYTEEMTTIGLKFEAKEKVFPPIISLESVSNRAKKEALQKIQKPGNKVEQALKGGITGLASGTLGGLIVGAAPGMVIEGLVGATIGAIQGYLDGDGPTVEQRLNTEVYCDVLKQEVNAIITLTCYDMQKTIADLFFSYDGNFIEKLDKVIKERKQNLGNLIEQKTEAETLSRKREDTIKKMTDLVQDIKQKIETCNELIKTCNELKEVQTSGL